jgi:hypothetical protein
MTPSDPRPITAPTTNADLYVLIDRIAVALGEAGDGESAGRVRSAVGSGSTSGEIFTNLRAELSLLLRDDAIPDGPLRDSIAVLLDVIDAALKRVGQFTRPS